MTVDLFHTKQSSLRAVDIFFRSMLNERRNTELRP